MSAFHAVSITDIIRAGGSLTVRVNGHNHRVRSDYPVVLRFNPNTGTRGLSMGTDSDTFMPNPNQGWFVYRQFADFVTLTLPPGYGGGPLGKLETDGAYGLCVIESEDKDAETWPVDPRLLVSHSFEFREDTGVDQVDIVQSDHFPAEFSINGKLPSEFYLTTVAIHQRETQIAPSNNPHYRIVNSATAIICFRQANGLASERCDLWAVAGEGCYTVSFPFLKMPLASLFSPWAGETPTIAFEYTEARTTHVQTQIVIRLTGAVRW